jgi:glycosyltransferase involved in cell wall biosynthesis
MSTPTISAVVTVYNAEEYIGEALAAILAQTHAPQEIVVVDDGSTDGTPRELARFGGEIRVVRQANGGHACALNRGCSEARGDYLAKCDADDVWAPDKLARQVESLVAHPQVDIAFAAAQTFGRIEKPFSSPPGMGVLDGRQFARTLYRRNLVCASSVLIRRASYERLGPFAQELAVEDYEYWMRAVKAGAVFFYDPSVMVSYRVHDANVTNQRLKSYRSMLLAHRWHEDLLDSPALVRRVLAADHFMIGRFLVDEGRPREGRDEFLASLRRRPTLRGLAWALVLSTPESARGRLSRCSVSIKRRFFPGASQRTFTGA